MKIKDIIKTLDLQVISGEEFLGREVTGGYAGDLLSDVLANSKKGYVWITLQIHQNIIAVASSKELSGIIIVNGRKPEEETSADEQSPRRIEWLQPYELRRSLSGEANRHLAPSSVELPHAMGSQRPLPRLHTSSHV